MYSAVRCIVLISMTVAIVGCANDISLKEVYGTYKAAYPFGTETITLNRDGSFDQKFTLQVEGPVGIHGNWHFDAQGSRVNFEHIMIIMDGTGHLKRDWRTLTPGNASLDVATRWFRVIMASAATYPYVKQ